jgi:hypothetical protein
MPISQIVTNSIASGAVAQVDLATNVAGTGPAFRVYNNSGGQSISSATFTKVLFDTEVFDTNNNFASSRFTPTIAGYYQINCSLAFSTTSTTRAIIGIYKNGAIDTYGNDLSGPINTQVATGLIYCNGSTDYLEIYVYIVGSSPTISSNASYPFSGCLVRSA